MTKQEIEEVLIKRPDLVELLTLARDNPELIPDAVNLLKGPEGMPETVTDKEGEFYVYLYEVWTDAIVTGQAPDCKRFRDSFMEYWGDMVKPDSMLYFLFYGFVAGLDFAEHIEQLPDDLP